MTTFDTLGLGVQLLHSIDDAGFTEPTSVQLRAIPLLLEGRDLMGTAQTGEGKTAAYLLPMLHRLAEQGEKPLPGRPRVLILAPTRELASQIGEALRQFSKGLRLFYTVIYGGTPFLTQRKVMERGVHILVATPGRLMDHMRRHTLTLDQVNCLVLDEADRMLDMGFVDEVKEIAATIPAEHQTVMFSATMNRGVRGLATQLLKNPGLIEIGRENAVAANVDHRVMRVKYTDKKALLLHLLARPDVSRVLVFSRTKAMADVLVRDVQDAGLRAAAIHGDLEQSMRQRVLRAFREGQVNILIATDVAARGIDVPDITHVINYDMPVEAEAYVHRVGRTGRAGAKGVALSICISNEGHLLRQIEQLIGIKVPVDAEQPFHEERAAGRDFRPAPGGRSARPYEKASSHRKGPPPQRDGARRDDAAPFRRPAAATARPARTEAPYRAEDAANAEAPQKTWAPYKPSREASSGEGAAPYRRTNDRATARPARADAPYKAEGAPAGKAPYKSKAPYKPYRDDAPRREHAPRGDAPARDGAASYRRSEGGESARPARNDAPYKTDGAPTGKAPYKSKAPYKPRRDGDAAAPYRGDAPRRDGAAPFRHPEADATARPARAGVPFKQTPGAFGLKSPYDKAKAPYKARGEDARRSEDRRKDGPSARPGKSSTRPGKNARFAGKPSNRLAFAAGERSDRPAKDAGSAPVRRRSSAGAA